MSDAKLVVTGDQSHTLIHSRFNEHYHSTFGAIQESKHVFIQTALDFLLPVTSKLNVLEVGFGTGLNAALTFLWSGKNKVEVDYTGIEAFPVSYEVAGGLNYPELLNLNRNVFLKMHGAEMTDVHFSEYFQLTRITEQFESVKLKNTDFDVVFFDAFSPDTQPEMWTESVFSRLFKAMRTKGVLTTYSTKGIVKRALKSAGFSLEKIPGPPGKREILRAVKK